MGEYREISDECKGKAFTVSGYTSLEVLQKFLDELTEACEQGKTKKDFMDTMNDFLERNGYEGLNPFNADVIFRTNMQTAYNAGHYKSMTNPTTKKLRPFWKYITAGDGEVRESHAQMEGRIYPADDPIWDITRNRLLIKKPLHNSLKDDTLQSQQHDHVHKVPMSIVPVA